MRYLSFAAAALLLTTAANAAPPAQPPNLILILADDFGYECVGANGGTSYRTPNLDRLAGGGMRFERCFAQPLCTPTRVQLMTGLYNVRNYIEFGVLDPQAVTFAHLLKKAGYATAIAGKWQLGKGFDLPQQFGFDEYCLWQLNRRPSRYANPGLEVNGKLVDYTQGEYGPDVVNDYALDFITRHRDEPFFLYYPMMLTHDPYQPTPDTRRYDPQAASEKVGANVRHFGHMVAYMDKLIGKVVARLEELQLRENTLIVFTGDNGTGKKVTSMRGEQAVRGGKGETTRAGTHVPLIVNWPGVVPEGQVCRDLIDSTDFLPTLCAAAGIPVPAGLDGVSFWPQLRGQKGNPREWVYCWYSRNGADAQAREFAATARYKLYRTGELYDYEADPHEQTPLAAPLPATAADARCVLQVALDRFADARPASLRKNAAGSR